MSERLSSPAPLIAVVGSDGSGKSTVCDHLVAWLGRYGRVEYVHLGKQSGNVLRAIGKWPVVGAALEGAIGRKAEKADARLKAATPPGVLPALVIAAFLLRRMRRFRRMLALRQTGAIIVADRFPQMAVHGAYDGPVLPDGPQVSASVRALARWEQARFATMVRHAPDLVLRLNVDLDTACARKPDHARALLERKIAATPRLRYGAAPIVDIDTVQPLKEVLRDVEVAVARCMAECGYESPGGNSAARGRSAAV